MSREACLNTMLNRQFYFVYSLIYIDRAVKKRSFQTNTSPYTVVFRQTFAASSIRESHEVKRTDAVAINFLDLFVCQGRILHRTCVCVCVEEIYIYKKRRTLKWGVKRQRKIGIFLELPLKICRVGFRLEHSAFFVSVSLWPANSSEAEEFSVTRSLSNLSTLPLISPYYLPG